MKTRLAAAIATALVILGLAVAPAGAEPNDEGNSWLITAVRGASVTIGHG